MRVALQLHEDIFDLARPGVIPPRQGLDQLRVELQPANSFLAASGLVIQKADFPFCQVHILPGQTKDFSATRSGIE